MSASSRARLAVTTTIRATTGPVPVAFGWHDYFQLPGPRAAWRLRLPAREHLAVDRRMIPTGVEQLERAEDEPIGDRTFDDGYALGPDRRFALTGRGVHIDVELDAGYSFGQIWVPPGRTFACLEPMTAPANALRTGDHATATPEEPYSATFVVRPRTA